MHERLRWRLWWLMASLFAGCSEPSTEEMREQIAFPPGIVGDTCTPVSSTTYVSCDSAMSSNGLDSGCFSILSPGFPAPTVARNCKREHILVVQVYDGVTAPKDDPTYLDAVLDSLNSFIDTASYRRTVLDLELAARWLPTAATHSAILAELLPADSLHSLDYYDSFLILSTEKNRGVEASCDITVGTTKSHRPCANVYHYRQSSDPSFVSSSSHHEVGHALGLKHDGSLSSAGGYGEVRTTFQGQHIEYGGTSSVMGKDNDALYNLPERVKLGWLNDADPGAGRHVVGVDALGSPVDTTVTFDTLEQNVEGIKGVYIPTDDGNYWIEARRDAAMVPALRTGVIIHFSDDELVNNQMIDATPETPADSAFDGTLPIGRTFGDPLHGVYITTRSETDTTATVEIHRDPVDANPPTITAVTATNCRTSPAACTVVPPPPLPNLDWWRYEVTASDADGDPLSYSWRFGIGTNESADGASYGHGAVAFRLAPRIAPASRAFVTVSDRKGGETSSFVDLPGYRAAWVGPLLTPVTLEIDLINPRQWTIDNEFRFKIAGEPTGTELLDSEWTIDGTTLPWLTATVDPGQFALATATAPDCIEATFRVTDTTNCTAAPSTCYATKTECVPVPLRLVWIPVPGPGGLPGSFLVTLTYDPTLFGVTPMITWTASCPLVVDPSLMSATMTGPGCKLTVNLDTNSTHYAVTAVPN